MLLGNLRSLVDFFQFGDPQVLSDAIALTTKRLAATPEETEAKRRAMGAEVKGIEGELAKLVEALLGGGSASPPSRPPS